MHDISFLRLLADFSKNLWMKPYFELFYTRHSTLSNATSCNVVRVKFHVQCFHSMQGIKLYTMLYIWQNSKLVLVYVGWRLHPTCYWLTYPIQINTGHHRGLEWIDASQKIAGIPWPRAKGKINTCRQEFILY